MIDLIDQSGSDKIVSLQCFIENEQDYDIAFCRAWSFIVSQKDSPVDNSKQLLNLLDKVQRLAMSHYSEKMHRRSEYSYFGLSGKTPRADEEGIADIIEKIWVKEEKSLRLVANDTDKKIRYLLTTDTFSVHPFDSESEQILLRNSIDLRSESLITIKKIMISLFSQGQGADSSERLVLHSLSSSKEREEKILKVFDLFFKTIESKKDDLDKITSIVNAARDVMQLHPYYDGNGRAIYLLSNYLMRKYGLKPFYPLNMCLFDANSTGKMVQEVVNGQERFCSMFHSFDELNEGLEAYNTTVCQLWSIINHKFLESKNINNSFKARNFNLLFRQVCIDEKYMELLEFMLVNNKILNINIFSCGKTSGNALAIARKYNNAKAISLLEQHLLP